jgi:hypothetical protein
MIEARTLRIWRLGAIALVGGVALIWAPSLLPGLEGPDGVPSGLGVLVRTAATLLALVWTVTFALQAFRQADEFRRSAATFAWHWGSLAGLLLSVPVTVFVSLGGLHRIDPAITIDHAVGRIFAYGYALALASQLVGYFALLAWWRGTKR